MSVLKAAFEPVNLGQVAMSHPALVDSITDETRPLSQSSSDLCEPRMHFIALPSRTILKFGNHKARDCQTSLLRLMLNAYLYSGMIKRSLAQDR